jgi:hypothetical protein
MHCRLTVNSFMPPPVAALSAEARCLLRAARMWVILTRHKRNAEPVIASLLGGATPAFMNLMAQLVTAWPDPFTTYPPCATAVSPDEAALLDLVASAGKQREPDACESLLRDLLPRAERAGLWVAACRLSLTCPF